MLLYLEFCVIAKHSIMYTTYIFHFLSRNEDILKYLLEAGCDIESKDDNQRTPVHWAAQDSGI